jgi:uncharacterized protein YraI
MARISTYCPVCNTEINLPDDITRLNCSNCHSPLVLESGEGYFVLRLDKKKEIESPSLPSSQTQSKSKQDVTNGSEKLEQAAPSASDPIREQILKLRAEREALKARKQTRAVKQRLNAIYMEEKYLLKKAKKSTTIQSEGKSSSRKRKWTLAAITFLIILCVLPFIFSSPSPDSTPTPTGIAVSNNREADQAVTSTVVNSATPFSTPSPSSTSTKEPTSTSTPAPVGYGTVSINSANLRSGPGQSYALAGNAKQGDELPIFSQTDDGDWLQIDWKDSVWIASSLITMPEEIAKIPTFPTFTPTSTYTPIPTNTPRPSNTPRPTNTPRPSATLPPAVKIKTIYDNFERMTELQFKEYKQRIAGKPVRENVEVGNVSDRGKVLIHGAWSPWILNWSEFCVVVTGIPNDFALGLNGGDEFYLEAVINGIVGDNNYYINCENTLVLNYRDARRSFNNQ